jgi:hypothetical protein
VLSRRGAFIKNQKNVRLIADKGGNMNKQGTGENVLIRPRKNFIRSALCFLIFLHYLTHARMKRTSVNFILPAFAIIIFVPISAHGLSSTPAYWHQVNEDGFFGHPPTQDGTSLFIFDKKLYAHNEYGLFRMENAVCAVWKKVPTLVSPGDWGFTPLGNYLYLKDLKNQLWLIKEGTALTSANLEQVTSKGLPGSVSPLPAIIFNGQIYGIYYDNVSGIFEIWRSKDIGKNVMNWTKVVANSFGDPKNNISVDIMAVFNNHIYVGTNTLKGQFGDTKDKYEGGVEIWESPSGDIGTWTQVNEDGFGTTVKIVGTGEKIFPNHVIGSCAVYKGHLYIGTKSHWGAEVWQYDGTGKSGWKNVTPSWAGCGSFYNAPGRNESMIVFDNVLYLAEGSATGNLAKFDGNNWAIVVHGPNPFDSQNGGLGSLAVFNNDLYVSTLHQPYIGATKGDQVWGYFPFVVWKYACTDLSWLNRMSFTMIDSSLFKFITTVKNEGPKAIKEEYLISVYLDGELIHNEVGPSLLSNEEVEISVTHDMMEGNHKIMYIADAENQLDEIDEDNNTFSFPFTVPNEEPPYAEERAGFFYEFQVSDSRISVAFPEHLGGDTQIATLKGELVLFIEEPPPNATDARVWINGIREEISKLSFFLDVNSDEELELVEMGPFVLTTSMLDLPLCQGRIDLATGEYTLTYVIHPEHPVLQEIGIEDLGTIMVSERGVIDFDEGVLETHGSSSIDSGVFKGTEISYSTKSGKKRK